LSGTLSLADGRPLDNIIEFHLPNVKEIATIQASLGVSFPNSIV
jgi:hypothetical protein